MATILPPEAGLAPGDLPSSVQIGTNGRRQRRSYAALDLGTNNCRLLIARPARQGFYIVDAFSRIVRLGEGLVQTGRLSDAAQTRAIEALKICADKLRRRDVHIARNVATEACRRASNGGGFIERVYAETGIALDVITSAEEARLAVLGCQSLIEPQYTQALVFDIGGGSTELILVDLDRKGETRIRAWTSVPWGVVSLAETEPLHHVSRQARLDSYNCMRERVAEHLSLFAANAAVDISKSDFQMLGTSGTITTLASLHLGLSAYDRRQVDGCWVPQSSMREVSSMLAERSPADRARIACIGTERADLVVAGCAILEAILDAWPVQRLRVADRGIREGILRTLMSRDGYLV